MSEAESLLKKAIALFKDSCDYNCGNTEGTPCDDFRPTYVCKYHKWIRAARKAVKRAPSTPPKEKP